MVTSSSHRWWRLLVSAIVLAPVVPAAQEGAPALDLQEALARVDARNPRLAALSFRARAADGLVQDAGLGPNPELGFEIENVLGTGALSGVRSLEATVQARQRFERGGKRASRVAAAERGRDAAAAELMIERREILRETALGFIAVLAAQERVALAAEPLQLASETVEAVEQRVAAGAGSPAGAARARAAAALARMEQVRAEAQLTSARAQLAALWGGHAEDVALVAGSLRVAPALASREALMARLSDHPRLRHQQAVIASLRAGLDLERAEAVPDVTVGGGLRFEREGSDIGFVAGVSMPLPVRNRNQGSIRAARENLAGGEQMLRAIEAELHAEFAAAWQEMAAARDAAHGMRTVVLPAAKEAHTVVTRAYAAGELPLIDVLEAHRELIRVRRELLELEAAFVSAHARMEATVDPTLPATTALLAVTP